MLDTRDWCDVDSNEEFCIPELPPLPILKWQIPEDGTSIDKEERDQGILSAISENPQRFRFDFSKEGSPKSRNDIADYVCFVGKFPNRTSIADLEKFVRSNGVNFTDVRIGPKKNPNANTFGYVDLPTRHDYAKLLSLDGIEYKGRSIRVDHATRKDTAARTPRRWKFQAREIHRRSSSSARRTKSSDRSSRGLKKIDAKTTKNIGRFQRTKTFRAQKTGTRNKNTYRKKLKSSVAELKSRRLTEALRQK